jgi:hypothetical protein
LTYLIPYISFTNLFVTRPENIYLNVRELMGWVRNVALIKYIFGSGKPRGGSGFWVGGCKGQVREQGSSLQATWERGGQILSQEEGSK